MKEHSKPILTTPNAINTASTSTQQTENTSGISHSGDNVSSQSGKGGLLLDGTYDESASSESFQEALTAWRTSNTQHNTNKGT